MRRLERQLDGSAAFEITWPFVVTYLLHGLGPVASSLCASALPWSAEKIESVKMCDIKNRLH
jgi:hypothetical protein